MIGSAVINGDVCYAMAIPLIHGRKDVKAFRDAILDVVDTVLRYEESKDVTSSVSLHILLSTIVELNKDLEG